eukprot:2310822-Prymnesium_polylepis.1
MKRACSGREPGVEYSDNRRSKVETRRSQTSLRPLTGLPRAARSLKRRTALREGRSARRVTSTGWSACACRCASARRSGIYERRCRMG